jgi:hypothetical protein
MIWDGERDGRDTKGRNVLVWCNMHGTTSYLSIHSLVCSSVCVINEQSGRTLSQTSSLPLYVFVDIDKDQRSTLHTIAPFVSFSAPSLPMETLFLSIGIVDGIYSIYYAIYELLYCRYMCRL